MSNPLSIRVNDKDRVAVVLIAWLANEGERLTHRRLVLSNNVHHCRDGESP